MNLYLNNPRQFDAQPVLMGKLVTLRPLVPSDFDALYTVAADPHIWEQHPVSDRHEVARFQEFFRDALASGGALIAVDISSQQVIGSSRYHGYDHARREVEIGWTFLARSHWGGHYNGEIKQLMLDHAFRFVERVVFLVGPQNIRSQRAVERIGGRRAGVRTDGTRRESFVYEITAHSYIRIVPAVTAVDIASARSLVIEYTDGLGIDLSFQDFAQELLNFPGDYSPPCGCLLLALQNQTPLGCIALHPLSPTVAEIKRLYVRPGGRGQGLGRALTMRAITVARELGYSRLRLDTLPTMRSAIAL